MKDEKSMIALEMKEEVNIEDVKVSAYTIPTDGPESDGTIEWNDTTMILVEIKGRDRTGIGYTFADVTSAQFIDKSLKKIVIGKNPMQIPFTLKSMIHSVRNNGNGGIIAMAISAVDNALWDLKAKILNLPLVSLLGKVKDDFQIYRSGGFTSYSIEKLQKQLGGWAEQGITQVKMKIGRESEKDVERVGKAREAIGKNTL